MTRPIDADALKKKQVDMSDDPYYVQYGVFVEDIDDAPTILTIPDNPTNGDMIRALFPDGKISRTNNFEIGLRFKGDNWIIWFKDRWWNAPYKKEADNEDSN